MKIKIWKIRLEFHLPNKRNNPMFDMMWMSHPWKGKVLFNNSGLIICSGHYNNHDGYSNFYIKIGKKIW